MEPTTGNEKVASLRFLGLTNPLLGFSLHNQLQHRRFDTDISQLKIDLKKELLTELREELITELREELKDEIKDELYREIIEELRRSNGINTEWEILTPEK